jgi:hypothetical protein
VTSRPLSRVAVVSAGVPAVVALAAPVLAAEPDAGAEPGAGMSVPETLLVFVGAPLGLFVLITLLVMAPSIARGGYKPSLGWWAEPVWFGGPADPYAALDRVEQGPALAPEAVGGGASARW